MGPHRQKWHSESQCSLLISVKRNSRSVCPHFTVHMHIIILFTIRLRSTHNPMISQRGRTSTGPCCLLLSAPNQWWLNSIRCPISKTGYRWYLIYSVMRCKWQGTRLNRILEKDLATTSQAETQIWREGLRRRTERLKKRPPWAPRPHSKQKLIRPTFVDHGSSSA